MYTKILVPLDGSPKSERALPQAIALLSRDHDCTLYLLRVLEIQSVNTWTSVNLIAARAEEERTVTEYLEGLQLEGLPERCTVERVIRSGPSPAKSIADFADKHGVDLIAMTCQGRSSFQQFLLGSQTERTLQLAKVSVLVVREP